MFNQAGRDKRMAISGMVIDINNIRITSVRPETRIFVRDQGMRKSLPQAYS